MSQDFFADLERQLVEAAGDRRRRLRRARARRATTVASVVVAVLAAGGGLAAAVTGGDGSSTGGPAGPGAGTTTERTVTADPQTGAIDQIAPRPGRFTVAVLNATTVPGLARGVANRLDDQHFKIGNVTNAATHDRSTTEVFYARPDCMAAAARTARAIGLVRTTLVAQAPTGVREVAGDEADVIVLVGSDQNAALRP